MKKEFTITGLGICYGQLQSCADFVDAMITGTSIEACTSENPAEMAVQEALKSYDSRGLSVISNIALDLELQQKFALKEPLLCSNFEQMIEAAEDKCLLVAGGEKGYLAILLTQDAVGFANISLDGVCKEQTDSVEMLLTILTVALEIRYALSLREVSSSMYRLWDAADKRETTISNSSMKFHFTEPETFCTTVYQSQKYILPVIFTTIEEAEEKLAQLKVSAKKALYPAMKACFAELEKRGEDSNTIVFMAEDESMLSAEIDNLLSKSKKLLDKDFVWRTKNGSLYIRRTCADPKVVFMNPPGGMFNAKIFYNFFYKLYGTMQEASRFVTDEHYTGAQESFFSRALFDMVVNYVITMLLDDIGITADILSGACQGELSIEYPLMKSKDGSVEDMREYLVMQLQKTIALSMSSDKEPLEKYLGRKVERFTKYYLKHDLEKVRKVVKKYDSVFIWIVGSAKDVMIEGEASACQKVIEELGCMATELADPLYIHTPIMEECREEIRKCILDKGVYVDVENLPYRVFSTAHKAYMTSDCEMLVDNFSHLLIDEVDYSEVPNVLYKDGARIFIDLSPIQLCNTWARTTLQKKKDAQVLSIYGNEATGMDLCAICAAMLAGNVHFAYEKLLAKLSFVDDSTAVSENAAAQEQKPVVSKGEKAEEAVVSEKTESQGQGASASKEVKAENAAVSENAAAQEQNPAVLKEVKAAANCAELEQYIKRQMAMNEEAFRLYMGAQNALYEQMLGTMTAAPSAEATANAGAESEGKAVPEVNAEPESKTEEKPYLWNREQVITMTDTSMAAVLGDAYKEVDKYPVRARMPLPPFLFVSRITEIDAEFGVLRPGRIVAEYDFDKDCVFSMGDTHISSCVAAEASHIGIFLMGYMGLDAMSNGTLSFRALDCNQLYLDDKPFCVGDTMRTVFTIHRFAQNGPTTILYYDYETWNGDTLVSRSEASGGFFTQAELASNKGVISPKIARKKLEPQPLLHYGTSDAVVYSEEQIAQFYKGNSSACFGEDIHLREPYRLQQKYNMQMLERITKIDYNGGKYGRGFLSGEKSITPDLWPFDVHFKNDPVFPGIIMIDGVTQAEIFLAAQTGIFSKFKNAEMRMVTNVPIVTKFRGQVRRGNSTLRYELHIKESKMQEDGYYLIADAAIFNDEVQVISIESFGLKVIGEYVE